MKTTCQTAILAFAILLLYPVHSPGQTVKRVLFLGNSYTDANNLPKLVSDIAGSAGKTLIYDKNAPGSYTLAGHLTNMVSLAKISAGNWDHVVLQDQSMSLAYPSTYWNTFPYTFRLDSTIKAQNKCAQIIFYATWGRKNGDTYLCTPPHCSVDTWITRTYYELDSAIGSHYKTFADTLKSSVTPVGTVWRYLRRHHPSIELFEPDESHPSVAGSYTAACCFYTAIFRSDPALITFNAGLPAADAAAIRAAVRLIVFDHLRDWNIGVYDSLLDKSCRGLGVKEEPAAPTSWQVFPNPVRDILSVQFASPPAADKIRVYNILGTLVKEAEVLQQTTTIPFSDLPSGLYLIRSLKAEQTVKVWKE